MAIRPEYLRRRIAFARRAEQETGKAADLLEAVIDRYLHTNAPRLVRPGVVCFPLADGTDGDVVDDVIQRYRSVGWSVERDAADGCDALCFRMIA